MGTARDIAAYDLVNGMTYIGKDCLASILDQKELKDAVVVRTRKVAARGEGLLCKLLPMYMSPRSYEDRAREGGKNLTGRTQICDKEDIVATHHFLVVERD